ncbi:MAG: glycosyltransferase family 9 protein [Armatimonadetes bacterium]|nr:glycosyltransferase family 9 protein [Armatimonadota bacterium]MDE2207336.1 glycosyltransferase family 9 protein [Armatimonadota bacterium]
MATAPSSPPTAESSAPNLLDGPSRLTLAICPVGIGNFIMVLPALRLLSDAIGRQNLSLLTVRGAVSDLARASGLFDQVYLWSPERESLAAGMRLALRMRRRHFAQSVSLFPTADARFALYTRLAGAPERVGFDYANVPIARRLQTWSAPVNLMAHDTDQNCDLVEQILRRPGGANRQLEFPIQPAHAREGELRQTRYYVCHPGSSTQRGMAEKRLPAAAFADVITRLWRRFGMACVLVGGPEETETRSAITAAAPEATLDIQSESFAELAAVVQNARFYLGNDSGVMHIATALGRRAAVFFGPTDPRRNGPYSQARGSQAPLEHLILRNPEASCSPCWSAKTVGRNPPCIFADTRCLQRMPIGRIWSELEAWVQRGVDQDGW